MPDRVPPLLLLVTVPSQDRPGLLPTGSANSRQSPLHRFLSSYVTYCDARTPEKQPPTNVNSCILTTGSISPSASKLVALKYDRLAMDYAHVFSFLY